MAPTLFHPFSFGEGLRTASPPPHNFQHPVGSLSRFPNPFSVCPTSPTCAPYFGGSLSINLAPISRPVGHRELLGEEVPGRR